MARVRETTAQILPGSANLIGGRSVVRRRESMELLPLVVATYPAFHVGYGVGMAHAVLRLVGASSRKR